MTEPSDTEWFDRPGGDPVELHEASPLWPERAAAWIEAIRVVLRASRVRMEHVGSTAVPGLIAKPVIDLQVSVPDVYREAMYRAELESLGLVLRAREPEHRFFRPPAGQPRAVHVHVCAAGSGWEYEHLLFRDYLRAHPECVRAYAELKSELAAEVGHDRCAYTERKGEFIRSVVEAARRCGR